ncbi:biopolymer transporter ExbD [soil metagenome]|jgi:biopolymer transport protein ExbD|nr:biopolymer transporter ExbD [Gemmatimonadota bacterium]
MAIQHGGFKRKSKTASEIPDSSLADIAFLLLIFFMVTTVFRRERPRDVEMPQADSTERVDERRSNIVHVWIEPDGSVFINDQIVPVPSINAVIAPLYEETQRRLVVAIRADRDVPYGVIDEVSEQVREAATRMATPARVNFATNIEERLTRARR